ncbi:MAG TPA: hypothetical protein VKB18_02115 [Gemmatimonadota bacterium]|nr:hypothetical protein [Gemmatimonadota bacterium]
MDRDLSMRMGAEDLLTVQRELARVPDLMLPTKLGEEDGFGGKLGGILYRLARFSLVDNLVPVFGRVVQHEVFGHGARAREFDWSASYSLELPPPLGGGGGSTTVRFPDGLTVTATEAMAFTAGGLEAEGVARQAIVRRWTARGHFTYHEALRYLWAWYDQAHYIYGNVGGAGDDVANYIRIYDAANGATLVDFNRGDLQKEAAVDFFDPMVWYSLYAVFGAHVVGARDSLSVPMLRLGSLRYLPYFRLGLSPFGPEYHSMHLFRAGGRGLALDLRLGDGRVDQTWGVAARTEDAWRRGALGLDLRAAVWHQPALALGGTSARTVGGGLGGLVAATGRWRFGKETAALRPSSLVVELGYKTAGFLEGERLGRGLVLRAGLGL